MKKIFIYSFSILAVVFFILQLTGCPGLFQKPIVELKEKEVLSLEAKSCDSSVFLVWSLSEGKSGKIKIDVSPDDNEKYPAPLINDSQTMFLVDGLKNGEEYTFTVTHLSSSNKETSFKTVTAVPGIQSDVKTYTGTGKSDVQIIKIEDSLKSLTVEKCAGKKVTALSLNFSNSNLNLDEYRCASYAALSNRSIAPQNSGSIIKYAPTLNPFRKLDVSSSFRSAGNLNEEEIFKKFTKESVQENFDFDNPIVNESYRYLFLDNSESFFNTSSHLVKDFVDLKKVTLRAIGKNETETCCFVWVDDDVFDDENGGSGKMINSRIAEDIADTFVGYCLHERDIFGKEADSLFLSTREGSYKKISMSENSPTKEAVNIVVYDIADDYEENSKETGYYGGYFYSRDYYSFENSYLPADFTISSNKGKYLYVDSACCNLTENNNFSGVKKNGESAASGRIFTIMFHEFQHMINYGRKTVDRITKTEGIDAFEINTGSSTWYNEMLSMLAEDMLSKNMIDEGLIIKHDTPASSRLCFFLSGYEKCGVGEWLTSEEEMLYSYATAYTFGAWLARNYGGPQLISKISRNNLFDEKSIQEAIKEQTGEEISWNSLLRNFYFSFAVKNNADYYSMNKNPGNEITSYGHTSSLEPIDVFSSEYKWTGIDSKGTAYSCTGAHLVSKNIECLRRNGMSLVDIQDVIGMDTRTEHGNDALPNNSCTVTFKGEPQENTELYLIIQNTYSNILK